MAESERGVIGKDKPHFGHVGKLPRAYYPEALAKLDTVSLCKVAALAKKLEIANGIAATPRKRDDMIKAQTLF